MLSSRTTPHKERLNGLIKHHWTCYEGYRPRIARLSLGCSLVDGRNGHFGWNLRPCQFYQEYPDRPKVSEMRLVKSLPLAFVLEVSAVRGTVDDGDLFIVSPSSSAAPEPGHGRSMMWARGHGVTVSHWHRHTRMHARTRARLGSQLK